MRSAIERVRPAGVDVRVEYLDQAWTLGESALPGADDADPTAFLRGGTVLVPPEPPPA